MKINGMSRLPQKIPVDEYEQPELERSVRASTYGERVDQCAQLASGNAVQVIRDQSIILSLVLFGFGRTVFISHPRDECVLEASKSYPFASDTKMYLPSCCRLDLFLKESMYEHR